jgi:hypothetical protein
MKTQQRNSEPTAPRRERGLREEVQDMFDQLAKALTAGDGDAVAALWETPGLVIGAHCVLAMTSQEKVAEFFCKAKHKYNEHGITNTRADLLDIEPVGERIVLVSVRWAHLGPNARELGHESFDYTLRRNDDGKVKIRSMLLRELISQVLH